jgi:hypothetical protein
MIDNRTTHLNLPLPDQSNLMKSEDVPRFIEALNAIDAAIFGKATPADIEDAINDLIGGAPGTLDTLNELAAALNDDASFAATVTAALAGKAASVHTHALSDITGLVSALAAKLEAVPIATTTVLGGVKAGAGLNVAGDGTLSVTGAGIGDGLPAMLDVYMTPTSNGQTSFTVSGGYTVGLIDVMLNGILIKGGGVDYTASNGTTVVLTVGANTVDELLIRKWYYIPPEIAVNKAGDTMTGGLNVPANATGTQVPQVQEVVKKTGDTMTGGLVMSDQQVSRAMLKDVGMVYFNSGTTNALDYTNGQHQRWAPNTGAQTLSIANWPPGGNLGELLIEGVNLGAATITWPTINWVKSDGTFTTTFSANGVTLQTSGIDFVVLWTRDAGATIYGKVIR